jgi:hypothetical protein
MKFSEVYTHIKTCKISEFLALYEKAKDRWENYTVPTILQKSFGDKTDCKIEELMDEGFRLFRYLEMWKHAPEYNREPFIELLKIIAFCDIICDIILEGGKQNG